ncbi:unnamed protein product [Dibothriocephalus latus]|uniref:ADF-H domain-containing protein n=1 Tax=Dibothriocephalus latus TaxID=60516 RepID=A0A3P7LS13_DIBLA|nr:unnamed protein product [Dibothriocephalus latus]
MRSLANSPATAAASTLQSADMLPATMQASMKAMEARPKAGFEARFEALEAFIGQSNELNRRAKRLDDFEAVNRLENDCIRTRPDMLVKRVNHIAAEHSVLLGKVEQVGAAVLDSHRSIPTCSMAAVGRLPLCSQESLSHFLERFKSDKDCLQQTSMALASIPEDVSKKVRSFKLSQSKKNCAIICKINTQSMAVEVEKEINDVSIDDLPEELAPSEPRYVLLSYVLSHDDSRVSNPYCLLFVSPRSKFTVYCFFTQRFPSTLKVFLLGGCFGLFNGLKHAINLVYTMAACCYAVLRSEINILGRVLNLIYIYMSDMPKDLGSKYVIAFIVSQIRE